MNLSPAYLKWKEETRNEGKQEGIQIGEQRGIQTGIQQVARNLLATDMDPSQVAAVTGLTLEQVRQLQA
jgi:predicted transposase/invertase (TIGR01784 family)